MLKTQKSHNGTCSTLHRGQRGVQEAGFGLEVRKDDQQVIVKGGNMEKDAKEKVSATLRRSFEVEEVGQPDGQR